MKPYRVAPLTLVRPSPPPSPIWIRALWWLSGGAKRLRAARMRRGGAEPWEVVRVFVGQHYLAVLIIDMIRAWPHDLEAREAAWRSLARMLTAPKRARESSTRTRNAA